MASRAPARSRSDSRRRPNAVSPAAGGCLRLSRATSTQATLINPRAMRSAMTGVDDVSIHAPVRERRDNSMGDSGNLYLDSALEAMLLGIQLLYAGVTIVTSTAIRHPRQRGHPRGRPKRRRYSDERTESVFRSKRCDRAERHGRNVAKRRRPGTGGNSEKSLVAGDRWPPDSFTLCAYGVPGSWHPI